MRDMASVLLRQENRFLLVHNIKHGLRIGPVGGKAENGESIRACALRESKEELSVDIKLVYRLGIYPAPSPEGTFRSHLYIAKITRGEPRIPCSELDKIGYFDWYSLSGMRRIMQLGFLNENLCTALSDLQKYLTKN